MYLIYTDKNRKSFGKNRLGLYSDGMFFIYGGLSISFNNHRLNDVVKFIIEKQTPTLMV